MPTSKSSGSSAIRDQSTGNTAEVSVKSNGKSGLEVIAQVEDQDTSAPGSPVWTSKFRSFVTDPYDDINNVNQSFSSLYSYSGSGKFVGFSARFNDEDVIVKATIDGETLFEIDCDIMEILFDNTTASQNAYAGAVMWHDARNLFTFNPNFPIKFDTSVTIEAKANNTSNSRSIEQLLVNIVQET